MSTLPVQPTPKEDGQLQNLPLAAIHPNPRQPRRRFGAAQIESLAGSLKNQGVLQPLVVRAHPEVPGRYQLIAGERRLRAMRLLGLSTVPAIVREIPDEALLETALVENLQREPLNPIEEALAYRGLLQHHGYSQEALAARLGKDRSTIANMIRLLALPPRLQEDLEEGRLTVGHARALLAVPEADRQLALRDIVLDQDLSVRQTECLVNRARGISPSAKTIKKASPGESREESRERLQFQAVQEMLERRYSTRVTIQHGNNAGNGKTLGKIEMEFYSMDDFNRLFDLLHG